MADINGIPYVEATDLVSAYPGTSLALATELDDQLAAKPTKTSSTTEPASPATGDLWYDTNSTPPIPKFYDGTSWQAFSVGAADFSNAASGTYSSGGVEYKWVQFTGDGTLTVTKGGFATVFLVAGGGGGGSTVGGGGGGGGIRQEAIFLPAGSHSVTVGGGGTGGTGASNNATKGSDSSIGSIITVEGGGEGTSISAPGGSGGSGGGAGANGTAQSGGAANANEGRAGSGTESVTPADRRGGGGGGACFSPVSNREPGRGAFTGITGAALTLGGGGGGGVQPAAAAGGTAFDGGGNGAQTGPGASGSANTGGGGGGAGASGTITGGNGGSGRVIVRVRTN